MTIRPPPQTPLLAALVLALAAVHLPSTAAAEQIDLVYSGGLRGFARTGGRFELQDRLAPALAEAQRSVDSVDVLHGLIAQHDLEMWAEDGLISSVLAFVASDDRSCDDGVLLDTWRTPTERFLTGPAQKGLAPALPVPNSARETRRLYRCTGGGTVVRALIEPHGPPPEARTLDAYDLRTGFRWNTADGSYLQLGQPRREAGRRLGVLRAALAATAGARFVDAGDFLEPGHESDDDLWEESRQIGFTVLESLKPLALAPGVAELARGPVALAEEATRRGLPYVATNWENDQELFPKVIRVTIPRGEGAVDVAFLGATDPWFSERMGALEQDGVTLLDPLSAVQTQVDALQSSESPPDLVVLLVNASSELQRRLRTSLYGVDLMLGDPSAATFRVERSKTEFRNVGTAWKAAPVTLPLDGIATASVTFGPGGAEHVVVHPLEVSASAPSDPELTAVITDVHTRRHAGRESALIPPEDPLYGVTEERWRKLVCEAVMEATDADAVFLDGLAFHRPTPGSLTEMQVLDRLRGGHLVEVHRVDGDRLVTFLQSAHNRAEIHCGAVTDSRFPRVHGRFVDPYRTYRIATTDATRRGPLGPMLARASSDFVGHLPKFRPLPGANGGASLHEIVLAELRDAGQTAGWADAWMARTPNQMRTQVLFRIRRVALHIERFEGARTGSYDQVPESLLNSPSSFTLGGQLDLALEVSDARVVGEFRFQADYARFAIDGLPAQETADDWVVSTSIDVPAIGLPRNGPRQIRPFLLAQLDSEFTPTVNVDGGLLPRQLDLAGFGGVSFKPWVWLRSFRLGAFASRDLSRLTDKGTEYGARLTGATAHTLQPMSALRIETAWDVQVFGDTPQDDAADLRLRMFGEVRASVRLVRFLRLGLFAQGLLVQGRVPETSVPAGSVTVGAALDLSAAVRLDVRPRLFP